MKKNTWKDHQSDKAPLSSQHIPCRTQQQKMVWNAYCLPSLWVIFQEWLLPRKALSRTKHKNVSAQGLGEVLLTSLLPTRSQKVPALRPVRSSWASQAPGPTLTRPLAGRMHTTHHSPTSLPPSPGITDRTDEERGAGVPKSPTSGVPEAGGDRETTSF